MRTIKPMRHWIGLLNESTVPVVEAPGTNITIDHAKREAFYGGNLSEKRQAVLDALDRVLGHQSPNKMDNVKVLREIQATAQRMADGIERHLRERPSPSV